MYNKTIVSLFIASIFSLSSFNVLSVERIKIPEGEFLMGCSQHDPACDKDEGPAGGSPVLVPIFYLDKYEVSVAEFNKCLKSKNCKRPKDFKRNKYCNLDAPQRGNHPINCIDWQDAKQYY